MGERYEYYIGNVEVLKENGRTIYRRNVGSTILRFDPLVDLDVQHSQRSQVITDHLGSTVAVHTPDPLAPWQYQSFEPFGNKLHQSAPSQMMGLITHWTDRGFTGHEGVDKAGIIHMNGRIYDPVMGRFLQADPFIQEPDNTQSLNRYSYVINNPLSYTDPSGYFFSRFVSQIWRPLANIVGCAAGTAAAQPYLCGATVAATGLVDGQSVLSSLRDGLIAGVQAVVFSQIGIAYNDVAGKEGIAAFLHGAVVAASSALQGGDPVSGFLSSSVTKGISLATKDYLDALNDIYLEAVIVGAIGGSISTLTGGKFANGAVTGAIGYVYNAKSKRQLRSDKDKLDQIEKDKQDALARLYRIKADIEMNQSAALTAYEYKKLGIGSQDIGQVLDRVRATIRALNQTPIKLYQTSLRKDLIKAGVPVTKIMFLEAGNAAYLPAVGQIYINSTNYFAPNNDQVNTLVHEGSHVPVITSAVNYAGTVDNDPAGINDAYDFANFVLAHK